MKNRFNSWQEFESWLSNRNMFHMQLGLDRILKGMDLLNIKQPAFPIVQIIGTNGKGSTCAFLAALSQAHGLKTGLFTSPHFISPKERILVDQTQLSDELWISMINKIFAAYSEEPDLTYFEFLTLLSLLLFSSQNIDLGIYEAGLGGINDATTALPAQVQAFTPIAMDHTAIIGPSLDNIAQDKAGAIRTDKIFTAVQYPGVLKILAHVCKEKKAELTIINPDNPFGNLGLKGKFQKNNAALALAILQYLAKQNNFPLKKEAIEKGLREAFIPGRMQYLVESTNHPSIILDGGHNPHGIANLINELGCINTTKIETIIFSCLADKDWTTGLRLLTKSFPDAAFYIVQLENSRACSATRIAEWLNNGHTFKVKIFIGSKALQNALTELSAQSNPVLLTGSFYLLAEFYKLYPQYLTRN